MRSIRYRVWFIPAVWLVMALPVSMIRAQEIRYTDAGRVRHAQHNGWLPNWSITRGDSDWRTFPRAHQFWYPQEEWNSGTLTGYYPEGVIEEIWLPGASGPVMGSVFSPYHGWSPSLYDRRYFRKVCRRRPPVALLGKYESPITALAGEIIDPNLPVEQTVELELVVSTGQTWTHRHFGVQNPNLDRSIIHHWRQSYEGITTLAGGINGDSIIALPPGQVLKFWKGVLFLSVNARPQNFWGGSNGNFWSTNRQDDWSDYLGAASRWMIVSEAPRAANLQIYYTRDADAETILDFDGSPLDDTGDPMVGPYFAQNNTAAETGEFLSDKIFGLSLFHYDETGGNHADLFSVTNPERHAPSRYFTSPNAGSIWGNTWWGKQGGIFQTLTRVGHEKSRYRMHFESLGAVTDGTVWRDVTFSAVANAPMVDAIQRATGGTWIHVLAGPYTLAPGEYHDMVFALAAADFPREESIALGRRYLSWLSQQKPGLHPNGKGLQITGPPVSDYEKWLLLEGIKDTLFSVVDQSFTAWHGGPGSGLSQEEKLAGMGLARYPDGPPAPDILVKPGPHRNDVYAWYTDASCFDDPDTGVDDFAGWRVYRKKGQLYVNHPDEVTINGIQDWELIAEAPQGEVISTTTGTRTLENDHYNFTYTFINGATRRVFVFHDFEAEINEEYYYAVSAYDDGSQNLFGFEPGTSQEGGRVPAGPVSLGSAGFPDNTNVTVVPNPWSRDWNHYFYNDQYKIMFANLPRLCTLKIYTETGDLVYTIEHTDLSAEEFWHQQTRYGRMVESGIYIIAVLNAKRVDPVTDAIIGSLPDRFVKFVIIR